MFVNFVKQLNLMWLSVDCSLTVSVCMDWVHGHRPLVKVFICVAQLCVPLGGGLVGVTGCIHTALVGIRHLYHPVANGNNINHHNEEDSMAGGI